MLDIETKRRIDEARDILVGKIPDPKSQVEQITIALIYKFMNDIDAESEELGGERTFFAGEFDKYRWANLVHSGLGGYEMLNLYTEALVRIPENPNIPPLFREIFNNVYLPYRDPETLRMFFNVIDDFTYDNSERLGDAFEHLLSVLGSQGDAGQFRTPRHIIDFMVKIIDPQKDERVMDPACGTAGFLVSSYKHIRDASSDDLGRTTLTPDEHARLVTNLVGYDISPDMVRLSLVNMYLHGFPQPNIHEYDTLTSEERWGEYSNVILANPPFMSPKGGIRPHNRFSVQSTRSEVLFVDYIAEHLTPDGRAAVIVPEGIIFQSQNAYKQLRKTLVDEYLVAVVSLPPGVFNPYSGVKTSILVMDKSLARRTNQIAFFSVVNDGYDLGAQRRPVAENDLPTALEDINEYMRRTRADETLDDFCPTTGLIVDKKRIAEDGEYNLTGERYREEKSIATAYPVFEIGTLIETVTPPIKIPKSKFSKNGLFPIIDQSQDRIAGWTDNSAALVKPDKPVVVFGDHTCAVKLLETPFAQGADGIKILNTSGDLEPKFLYYFLKVKPLENRGYRRHFSALKKSDIPLPPLQVQREIVAEIEGYQRVMDGARAVIENYRPHIAVDPEWTTSALGEVMTLEYGKSLKAENRVEGPYPVYGSNGIIGFHDTYLVEGPAIVVGRKGTAGAVNFSVDDCFPIDTTFFVRLRQPERLDIRFCYYQLCDLELDKVNIQSGVPGLNRNDAYKKLIAVPSIEMQRSIVAEIEAERAIVNANRELVKRMEARIEATIGRVWETNSKA